jgi:hypothetical protein
MHFERSPDTYANRDAHIWSFVLVVPVAFGVQPRAILHDRVSERVVAPHLVRITGTLAVSNLTLSPSRVLFVALTELLD